MGSKLLRRSSCIMDIIRTQEDRFSNEDIRRELKISSIKYQTDEYRNRWLRHVEEMTAVRLPRQVHFYKPKGNNFFEDRQKDGLTLLSETGDIT